jgi:hypothetical protein
MGSRSCTWARREGRAASPVAKRVTELERRITEHETEKRQAETDITAVFSRGNHQEGRRLANRLARVSRMLRELYEEWEATATRKARLAAGPSSLETTFCDAQS